MVQMKESLSKDIINIFYLLKKMEIMSKVKRDAKDIFKRSKLNIIL